MIMAAKSAKPKRISTVANLYLTAYNLVQTIGWSYILYKYLQSDFLSPGNVNLWHTVKVPLIIFQNAAILEIIHASVGLVSSNPVLTTFQVLSRLLVVDCVLSAVPESYAPSSIGLSMCLLAWAITEIIRYSYYFMNLLGFMPHFLVWCRYTFFIVLYPLGVSGELLCCYSALQYAISNPEAWSYALPNSWNFTFSYHYLLLISMVTYIPGFPQLYSHMFKQRRKILSTDKDSVKKAR